jgi:hypothetical protein
MCFESQDGLEVRGLRDFQPELSVCHHEACFLSRPKALRSAAGSTGATTSYIGLRRKKRACG